ncbi:MAG: hypothetical protein R2765_11895 [Ferruginibacter sp.]
MAAFFLVTNDKADAGIVSRKANRGNITMEEVACFTISVFVLFNFFPAGPPILLPLPEKEPAI